MHFLFRCICLRRSTPAVPGHFLVSPVVGPAAFDQVPMGSQTHQIREKNSMNIYHAPQEFQPGTHSLKRSRGSGLFHTAASQPSVFRSTRHLIRQCVSCHPQRHIYSASFPLHVIICRRQSASCLPPAFNVQHQPSLTKVLSHELGHSQIQCVGICIPLDGGTRTHMNAAAARTAVTISTRQIHYVYA